MTLAGGLKVRCTVDLGDDWGFPSESCYCPGGADGIRDCTSTIGTLGGLVLGWGLIELDLGATVQFGVAVVSIFVFFCFLFLRYWVSAMGITLAVVLCLSVYHGVAEQILSERLLFTVLGCLIAVIATFLFPVRHSQNLKAAIHEAILTNRDYLASAVSGMDSLVEVKLARKKSYLALSSLNEAILLASKEPRWKRGELRALRQIELLCFQVNALTAALPVDAVGVLNQYSRVLADLDACIEKIVDLDSAKVFDFTAMERLDGILDLENVAGKLRLIIAQKLNNTKN